MFSDLNTRISYDICCAYPEELWFDPERWDV